MLTHILYQVMGKFGISSTGFRKFLSTFISLMVFGLIFAAVRFTGIQIKNFNRNIIMLAAIDLAGFGFLVWNENKYLASQEKDEKPTEEPAAEEVKEPVAEPVKEPVEEPVKKLVAEPAAEQVAEPIAEPVAEPVEEPVAEPVDEKESEPIEIDA
jgi:outer membrane biosynthesis protein TonB